MARANEDGLSGSLSAELPSVAGMSTSDKSDSGTNVVLDLKAEMARWDSETFDAPPAPPSNLEPEPSALGRQHNQDRPSRAFDTVLILGSNPWERLLEQYQPRPRAPPPPVAARATQHELGGSRAHARGSTSARFSRGPYEPTHPKGPPEPRARSCPSFQTALACLASAQAQPAASTSLAASKGPLLPCHSRPLAPSRGGTPHHLLPTSSLHRSPPRTAVPQDTPLRLARASDGQVAAHLDAGSRRTAAAGHTHSLASYRSRSLPSAPVDAAAIDAAAAAALAAVSPGGALQAAPAQLGQPPSTRRLQRGVSGGLGSQRKSTSPTWWLEVTASAVREQQGRRRVSCGAAGLGKNDGAQPAPRAAYSFGGVRRNVPQVEQLPTCREAPGL